MIKYILSINFQSKINLQLLAGLRNGLERNNCYSRYSISVDAGMRPLTQDWRLEHVKTMKTYPGFWASCPMYSFVRYDLEWKCTTFSDRQTSHSFFFWDISTFWQIPSDHKGLTLYLRIAPPSSRSEVAWHSVGRLNFQRRFVVALRWGCNEAWQVGLSNLADTAGNRGRKGFRSGTCVRSGAGIWFLSSNIPQMYIPYMSMYNPYYSIFHTTWHTVSYSCYGFQMDFGVRIPIIPSIFVGSSWPGSRWSVLGILKAPRQWYHPAGTPRRLSSTGI